MEHHRGVAATLSGHLEVISKVAFEFGAERTATDIGQPSTGFCRGVRTGESLKSRVR